MVFRSITTDEPTQLWSSLRMTTKLGRFCAGSPVARIASSATTLKLLDMMASILAEIRAKEIPAVVQAFGVRWSRTEGGMQTTRREWLAAAGGLAFASRLKAGRGLFHATSLNHISLTVPDVKSAADFYARVLGTRIIQDMGSRGQMRGLKLNYLALFQGDEAGLNHFSPGVDGLDEAGVGAILKQHGYEPFDGRPTFGPASIRTALRTTFPRQCAARIKWPRRTARIPGRIPSCMRSTSITLPSGCPT